MKRKRYSKEQIVAAVKQHELGAPVADIARKLGIAEQVTFHGFVEEDRKLQLLANSDVFVLVSHHEGFGLVYLEAMHCELPVIAAKTGGQVDFLEDGKTGFLVPPSDPEALAAALRALVDDSSLRGSIGPANRQIAERYTNANVARQYEEMFEETSTG